MEWFKNKFKRKPKPKPVTMTVSPQAGQQIEMNPEFVQFMNDLGPDFWPVCECFTGEMRQARIADLYDLACKAGDNFMMNMTLRGFCVKSGPIVLALIVNRVLAVGAAGTASTKAKGREPEDADMLAELTDRLADFQQRSAKLTSNAMEKLGCTKS